MIFSSLHAQEPDLKLIPKFLGASSFSNEFWVTIPPCYVDESALWDNFIKIFVTSQSRTEVTVEVPGKGYLVTKNSIANDVIEFRLFPETGQPFTKKGSENPPAERIFPGAGIHIYADQPIACYVVVRYKYTSDGFLAIPVSALGSEYIVAGFNEEGMFGSIKLPNMTGIVAAFDDTQVQFTLGGNSETITAGGMKPGDIVNFTMQRGDVWMVSTGKAFADLSGSKITSSNPVGVVTGNQCANIPTGNQWCDYTVEMDLPTYTWGKDVIVPKVPYRKYPSIVRIFAKEPNTNIYKDCKLIGQLKNSGGKEGDAYLSMRMGPYVSTPKPSSAVFSGDKPINVVLYNTGVQEDGNSQGIGDPFVMGISPVEQFQTEILFCTPGINGAMGFAQNYVNLVYETDEYGLMPDDFEFSSVIGGQFQWSKMKPKFEGVDELLPCKVNGKNYAVKLITLPGDGVYKIRAKNPFAAYSFGYSDYDSYGYPAAARMWDQEKQDTSQPTVVYNGDDFSKNGSVTASVTDMPENASIRSNLGLITLQQNLSTNCVLNFDPIVPGSTRSTSWKVDVINKNIPAVAVISFYDRRGNDSTVVIQYDPQSNQSVVKLISPLDKTDNLYSDIKFIWFKASVPYYRLQIAENSVFNNNLQSFDLTDTFKVVSGFKKYTEYFWRVFSVVNDSVEKVIASSSVRSFKTALDKPQKVVLVSPKNNTIGLKTIVDFKWDYLSQPQPDKYNIEVARDSAFKDWVNTEDNIPIKKTSLVLYKNNNYYWRVNAMNSAGTGPWSDVWKINVTNDAVRLRLPANNSINIDQNGELSWESIGGSKYQVQVSTVDDFSSTVIDISDIQFTFASYTLLTNSKYYWRVRAIDSLTREWSEVWNFVTTPKIPVAFNLISPPDKSVRQEYNPTFRWTNAGMSVQYTVLIGSDPNVTTNLQEFTTTNENLTVSLNPNLTYYWTVKAKNYSGTSYSKEVWSVKTGTILDVAQLNENEPGITIEPNPVHDILTIQLSESLKLSESAKLEIYSTLGLKMYSVGAGSKPAQELRIDVSSLPLGMYFVRVGDRVSKFVKI
jgi:hypothetical protein